jgi:hypothetical protein
MPGQCGEGAEERGLIDLTGLSSPDLDKFGESSLAFELRRVYDGDRDPDAIARFSNYC